MMDRVATSQEHVARGVGADDGAPVGRQVNGVGVPGETRQRRPHLRAGRQVPEAHDAGLATRHQRAAVGRDVGRQHTRVVGWHGLQDPPCGRVPEDEVPAVAPPGRDHELRAIRRNVRSSTVPRVRNRWTGLFGVSGIQTQTNPRCTGPPPLTNMLPSGLNFKGTRRRGAGGVWRIAVILPEAVSHSRRWLRRSSRSGSDCEHRRIRAER